MLKGRKILLCVTGSIAAYKSAALTRLLVKAGAEVRVVMTHSASEFITAPTLATLSKNPVLSDFYTDKDSGTWTNHVDLGLWADLMLVAPASANTLAKMASGISDNLLLTTYLSARCPVWVCPAMDLDMYAHSSTQRNLETLRNSGVRVIDAQDGELASGLEGKGRMEEPENIVQAIVDWWGVDSFLQDKTVLITAGPTYEPIDPVRFIGNRSSGKMGYALAEAAANLGARVVLVSGPVQVKAEHPSIEVVPVETAAEMYQEAVSRFNSSDVAILAAAVADYTPEQVADQKIKKESGAPELKLTKTRDILAELGGKKTESQTLIGFALETNDEESNAWKKLKNKNLDFIVLNSLRDPGAGFSVDTNKITILDKNQNKTSFDLKSKTEVASDIINYLKSYWS
ncbi:bifunctional phosphopantothenoylcysteine decarboxylase/phosphopantothenate--cysteine ligase CoaBC [bacterium SCSIO 12741]|nr:bifunctional phosphopantothenoylcysteine decarboxylase/phosphopantothenate--cysteine ligase CoaBC [bacterium SCSIO 12741]